MNASSTIRPHNYIFFFNFILWQCCGYGLLRFKHKKHLVGFGKKEMLEMSWGLVKRKICFCHHRLFQGLLKNIQLCHTYNCWNPVITCSHCGRHHVIWNPGHEYKMWASYDTFFTNANMVKTRKETLIANVLSRAGTSELNQRGSSRFWSQKYLGTCIFKCQITLSK